jgi:ribose transport system substrate-binding protein
LQVVHLDYGLEGYLAVLQRRGINSRQRKMKTHRTCVCQPRRLFLSSFLLLILVSFLILPGCQRQRPITIAVIPRTSGTALWEPEHGGAMAAASEVGAKIYWNAPTRDDDIQGQIALVEQVIGGNFQGLILAPDHSLALITPVRSALWRGLPTVIVGSPLAIPPGNLLSYVLNDDEAGGRMAAERVASLLPGNGSVAILGINPDITGIMIRTKSLEQFLAKNYPNIHVVAKRMGSFNLPHEQQVAEETLKSNPELDVIIALTSTSTNGAVAAMESRPPAHAVKIIGFDPDSAALANPLVDSLIMQNTKKMGSEAVHLIVSRIHGEAVPANMLLEPVMITRENVNSPEIRELTSMDWSPRQRHWRIAP